MDDVNTKRYIAFCDAGPDRDTASTALVSALAVDDLVDFLVETWPAECQSPGEIPSEIEIEVWECERVPLGELDTDALWRSFCGAVHEGSEVKPWQRPAFDAAVRNALESFADGQGQAYYEAQRKVSTHTFDVRVLRPEFDDWEIELTEQREAPVVPLHFAYCDRCRTAIRKGQRYVELPTPDGMVKVHAECMGGEEKPPTPPTGGTPAALQVAA